MKDEAMQKPACWWKEGKSQANWSSACFQAAFYGWVVVQTMCKGLKMGCGAAWKMLHVFHRKFYDKAAWWSLGNYEVWKWCNFLRVLGLWQCRAVLLSKNTLFSWLSREWLPSALPSLAKAIMKTTQYETEQPLSKSCFGLIFQGCWVQVSSMDFSRAIWVCSIMGGPSTQGGFFHHWRASLYILSRFTECVLHPVSFHVKE